MTLGFARSPQATDRDGIDTHGFATLDPLRASHDHVASLLMDRQALMTHQALWGIEDRQELRDLTRLTAEESSLFNDLRDNRLGLRVSQEQERIGFGRLRGGALDPIQADNPGDEHQGAAI